MNTIIAKSGLIAFVMLLLAFNSTTYAQSVAYVDAEAIIQDMPEYRRAKSEVEAYGQQLQKRLEKQQQDMAAYYQEVAQKEQAGTLTPKEGQEAQVKLQQMQEALQKAALEADQKLVQKEAELTKPLYEKFDVTIKSVAKANGYAYILDKKLLLYSEGGIDATSKVKSALGL
ncbi:MAG: OmpH family outer membrane protein [Saprospiraceae bacterium]|nr:OmpH family outer membrane protein [Saprospiraceae bacterium]